MSAEVSFTKRAAAELSRCFNSLSVSKNSSNKKPAASVAPSSPHLSSPSSSSTSSALSVSSTSSAFKTNSFSSQISKDKESTIKGSKVQNEVLSFSEKNFKVSSTMITNLDNNSRKQSVDQYHNTHSKPNHQFIGIKNYFEEVLMNKSNSVNLHRFRYLNQTRKKPPPKAPPKPLRARKINYLLNLQKSKTTQEMWQEKKFLTKFFLYFTSKERCLLAQVCVKWKDVLYSQAFYWKGLLPIIYYNELRRSNDNPNDVRLMSSATTTFRYAFQNTNTFVCDPTKSETCDSFKQKPTSFNVRSALYLSLEKRCFDSVCLYGATDADIIDFASKMSSSALSGINFGSIRCSCLTDKGLEIFLAALSHSIKKLEISGCNEISDSGIWASLVPRLESLIITDCINIADETVAAITQLLPALNELTLQAYHVTDTSMAYFGRTSLRETIKKLHLLNCWELSNQGVLNIAHSLPHLQSLSLSGCSKISDDSIEVIAEQLKELRRLDLSWCSRINDAALEYIACDLSGILQDLILDRCHHITDIGLGYIATMSNLTSLSLRWCSQISDFGLQTLCSIKSLKSLSLAGCAQFSINGLSCLVQMQQISELELTNCPEASKELLDYLKDNLPLNCTIIT